MKLLIFYITILSVIYLVYGRPQIHVGTETASEAQAALSRSFEKKNYQDLNLPPIQSDNEKNYEHPYNYNLINDGSGNYYFGYNTFDKTGRYEIGELKNAGTDNEIQTVRGQYIDRYSTLEGTIVRTIGYTADENGYRPFLIDIHLERFPMGGTFNAASYSSGGGARPPAPPGAPKSGKKGICTAAIASLCGGGLGK